MRIADEASHSFSQIADDIDKVRTLVRDISVSSEEQSRGVAQINTAIGEVAKSALSTSQQADELAASAAEMQAATSSMRQEMSRYRLRKPTAVPTAMPGLDQISPEILAYLQDLVAARAPERSQSLAPRKPMNGTRSADHDERGFADF